MTHFSIIITIDKSKELTRKDYVDFLQKTKGETISESRISQLVTAGKLKVRDYPELNNLQLIVLNDEEQALAQARFTTAQAIHTYSYKELGLMFGKLVHDLINENGNAQTVLAERKTQLEELVNLLTKTEGEREDARKRVQTLTEQVAELTQINQAQKSTLGEREGQLQALQKELNSLHEQLKETQLKLSTESYLRGEFDDFKKMILGIVQQPHSGEKHKKEKAAVSKKNRAGKSSGGGIKQSGELSETEAT